MSTTVPDNQDLILVLTKSHATASLVLPSGVPVLTLQNGLGNAEILCEKVGEENVLAGSTSEASTFIKEGTIRHAASGTTTFGAWTTCPNENAQNALQQAGFAIEITNNPRHTLWEKAAVSAGLNPLTAILNVPNGELIQHTQTQKLLGDLVTEATHLAKAEGFSFDYSLVEKAEAICASTATNISSMLQDIRAKRKTEIESISGEILRRCNAKSIAAPCTRVIYQLIKGMEASA